MVSFDVKSLSINLPLNGGIDLAVKHISEGNPGLNVVKMSLRGFSVLLPIKPTLRLGQFLRPGGWRSYGFPPSPLFSPISSWGTMKRYG